jgi:hypothetical protein
MFSDQVIFVVIKGPQLGKILVNNFRKEKGIRLVHVNHGTRELRYGIIHQLSFF